MDGCFINLSKLAGPAELIWVPLKDIDASSISLQSFRRSQMRPIPMSVTGAPSKSKDTCCMAVHFLSPWTNAVTPASLMDVPQKLKWALLRFVVFCMAKLSLTSPASVTPVWDRYNPNTLSFGELPIRAPMASRPLSTTRVPLIHRMNLRSCGREGSRPWSKACSPSSAMRVFPRLRITELNFVSLGRTLPRLNAPASPSLVSSNPRSNSAKSEACSRMPPTTTAEWFPTAWTSPLCLEPPGSMLSFPHFANNFWSFLAARCSITVFIFRLYNCSLFVIISTASSIESTMTSWSSMMKVHWDTAIAPIRCAMSATVSLNVSSWSLAVRL
mmetsp:Transcript_9149/g.23022  ORF Transcript_9149/g.23022 Transcript_9149/m.23022 type:complete len:329 (-) Transcript_9149:430-1416(-)